MSRILDPLTAVVRAAGLSNADSRVAITFIERVRDLVAGTVVVFDFGMDLSCS